MIGQGYDCNFGVSGSYTGFGNITTSGQKYSNKSKKKLLMNGGGTTVGYKYYDFYEEASIDGWISSTSGNTGTIAPETGSIGSNLVVSGAGMPSLNGTWSVDSFELTGKVEDTLSCTVNVSRYAGTTIS